MAEVRVGGCESVFWCVRVLEFVFERGVSEVWGAGVLRVYTSVRELKKEGEGQQTTAA